MEKYQKHFAFLFAALWFLTSYLPSAGAAKDNGSVVFARRALPAGKLVCCSDVGRIVVEPTKIPGKVLGSPLEVVGYKTKCFIAKNEMISSFSLDFDAKLNASERRRSKEEFNKASVLWSRPSDSRWLNFRRAHDQSK